MRKITTCNLDTVHITGLTYEDKGETGNSLIAHYVVFNRNNTMAGLQGTDQRHWPDKVSKRLLELLKAVEDVIAEGLLMEKEAKEEREEKDGGSNRGSLPGIQGLGPQLGSTKTTQ